MKVHEVLKMARQKLAEYKIENPGLDAEILLAQALSVNRLKLLTNMEEELPEDILISFQKLLNLRCDHIPVSYITGHKEFFGLEISVGPGVLIPRPETEFVVEEALDRIKNLENPKVIDLCCGSGAIAVSIAVNHKGATIYASDISDVAERYTKENAKSHHVDDRIFFIKGDLWKPFEAKGIEPVDVVVSNPPYIPEEDLKKLPEDVKKEPELALNGGELGLKFYDEIIQRAPQFMKPGGFIILEIGWNQAAAVEDMLKVRGFMEIKVVKDYRGFDRVISAKWKA